MHTTAEAIPFLRCPVFRWHDFLVRSTPDGGRYQLCRRCAQDRGRVSKGPLTTPPWPSWAHRPGVLSQTFALRAALSRAAVQRPSRRTP